MVDITYVLQGYFTGTGAISASEGILKNMGKLIVLNLSEFTKKIKK